MHGQQNIKKKYNGSSSFIVNLHILTDIPNREPYI